jgi:hypothetical protein
MKEGPIRDGLPLQQIAQALKILLFSNLDSLGVIPIQRLWSIYPPLYKPKRTDESHCER